MSTRAFYHPANIEVDLARPLPSGLYEEIASWRNRIRRAHNPVLTCLGNGKPMYVYRHGDGRFYMRHFPGDATDGHKHPAMTRMSDAHKRESEYIARAAQNAGLEALLEHSTGNGTRLDVAVVGGACNMGTEVQRSPLSKRAAITRTRKSRAAGYAVAWIDDKPEDSSPEWADHVPTTRLTTRGWDEQMPPQGTAKCVVGRYMPVRHGIRWTLERQVAAGTLDRFVERGAEGGFMSVELVKRGTVVLAVDDGSGLRDDIAAGRFPGFRLWQPGEVRERKTRAQTRTLSCHTGQRPPLRPIGQPDLDTCPRCGRRLFWSRDGMCVQCKEERHD